MYDTHPGTRPGQERFVAPLDETPLRAIDAVDVDAVPESQWREAWKRLRKSPLFWLASLIILVLAVMVALPTLFTNADPNQASLGNQFAPPSEGHPFGYNFQGADIWARTVYGARASVAVGVLATLVTVFLGMVTGAIAGFYGGLARHAGLATQRHLLLDPAAAGGHRRHLGRQQPLGGSGLLGLGLGGGDGTRPVRVASDHPSDAWRGARGQEPRVRRRGHGDRCVQAHQPASTHRPQRAVTGHRVGDDHRSASSSSPSPRCRSSVSACRRPIVSWGNDLSDAQNLVRSGQHLVVMWVPATALAVTVLGFVLLGEAVREALDPKARKS